MEQEQLATTLDWLNEASGATTTPSLATLVVSGILLEDTRLRRRIQHARLMTGERS